MERFVKYKKGDVVIFEFPFSDINKSKKRPSVVVATLKGNHIILAQITGQPRPDLDLLNLNFKDFKKGGINRDSFIRPSVLFTLNKSKINYKAGHLTQNKIIEIEKQLCEIFTR